MFEFLKKKAPIEQVIALPNPLELGYEEFTTILSDRVVIRFSVPSHVWNELRESKEWKDFQNLLEKYQTEYIQKQR